MFGDSQIFGGAGQILSQGATPSQGAQGGRARTDEAQACIPVTVRLLDTAIAKVAGDAELTIHGTQPAFVVLVGAVEALTRQATGLEFSLNDATGRIRVRYFSSDQAALAGVAAGAYVTVVGTAKASPAPHVSAQWVTPCASADQISYHAIEVAHAALRIQKGVREPEMAPSLTSGMVPTVTCMSESRVRTDDRATPPAPTPQSVATPARAASTAPEATPQAQGVALQDAVLQVLAADDRQEGVPISELMTKLPGVTQESALRSVVDTLIETGDAFYTIDEHHVAKL